MGKESHSHGWEVRENGGAVHPGSVIRDAKDYRPALAESAGASRTNPRQRRRRGTPRLFEKACDEVYMKRYIDGFVVGLVAVVVLGIVLPTSGQTAEILSWATKIAIGVLFLLYGARLSTAEVLAGMRHWRLQLTIIAITFAVHPVIGTATGALVGHLLPEDLVTGFVLLTLICATVQTCVSNTAIARGNVPAAIIAASTSSVLGVFVTPLLVAGILATTGAAHVDLRSVVAIVTQLLLPFVVGQLIHTRLGGVLKRNGQALKRIDRGLILFALFAAFSKGAGAGVWGSIPLSRFAVLLALCVGLLVVVMGIAGLASRLLRFSREDRIVVMFVGTSKSLAVALPMATVLFAGQEIALIILPMMFYHPVQMIVCSFIAQRMGQRVPAEVAEESARSALSPAVEELLLRLHTSGGDGRTRWIAGGDDPPGSALETVDVARAERHDDPRARRHLATRMCTVAAGNGGAMVVDVDGRAAVERFATSARTDKDKQRLIEELRSAGMLAGGLDSDEALAELLAAAGDDPIWVVGFADESIGLRNGNHHAGIDLRPGDAIYYAQHGHSPGFFVDDDSTLTYEPPRELAQP